MTDKAIVRTTETPRNALASSEPSLSLASVPQQTQGLLVRMFANPNLLAKDERVLLAAQLRDCVALHPKVSDLRVVYGMALSVNLDAQQAMEELGEAVALDPNSFIAHFKMGELWMRLRVCEKAKNHTHQAVLLAQNMAQAEMARRQAATLRVMMREGVDRSGYRTPWSWLGRLRRLWHRNRGEAESLATVDIS